MKLQPRTNMMSPASFSTTCDVRFQLHARILSIAASCPYMTSGISFNFVFVCCHQLSSPYLCNARNFNLYSYGVINLILKPMWCQQLKTCTHIMPRFYLFLNMWRQQLQLCTHIMSPAFISITMWCQKLQLILIYFHQLSSSYLMGRQKLQLYICRISSV